MGAGMLHAHLAIASQHVCLRQRKDLHGISSALICTTDSTVSQPPVTLLIHVHCHQNVHFNLDMRHKLTLGFRTLFVNAASHECRPFWMTSQWSTLTNQRPLFHTRYFWYTIDKFHGTFHTCMNSYVEDFIRVSNQTRLKKYMYVKFREWYCIMMHV